MKPEDIQELINKEISKQNAIAAEKEKEIQFLEKSNSELWSNREAAVKDLKKRIEDIEKPYNDQIKMLDEKKRKVEHEKWEADLKSKDAAYTIKGKLFENGILDADSLKGYMLMHGIRLSHVKMITKPLNNGVILFRNVDSLHSSLGVSYFAVKNKGIVGFCLTKKAEHRGDYPEVWSWTSCQKMRQKNCKHYGGWHDGNIDKWNFTMWKEDIEGRDALVAIDLDDESNRKVLMEDWQLSYDTWKVLA